MPIAIASTRDYNLIFSTLAEAGIDVFFPTTLYEEIPVKKGLGFESDLVPPPYGSATSEIYDLAREYGIKIAFSADSLFPIDNGGVPDQGGPLAAIIAAGGRDIIHSFVNYDEPVLNGLSPADSQAVYEHVKNIDPTIKVVQVHAPVDSDNPEIYLQNVKDHAEWADVVGFDVYPINANPGARTPYTFDELLEPAEALRDYMSWLEANFPDKEHVMVLQAFEQNDLHSDESLNTLSPEDLAFSRAPTQLEMREMLLAVQDADIVYWWGQSLQETSDADVWQSLLNVSKQAADGTLGTPMGDLQDVDNTSNIMNEDVADGAVTGITLRAVDPDAIDTVFYSLDDDRFTVDASGIVKVSPNAQFDFETEPTVTVLATAKSTDGTKRTLTLTVDIRDVIDQLFGTSGGDQILGAQGIDHIFGLSGDDIIDGQGGADSISGGAGNDFIYGRDADDFIFGGEGADVASGGLGNDTIEGGDGSDYLTGDEGQDILYGGVGADQMQGGGDDDTLFGDAGSDQLSGGDGHDLLWGGIGHDILMGDLGSDTLHGQEGDDIVIAGDGDDIVFGGDGADQLSGGAGSDTINGDADRDVILGGAGADMIYGGAGDDDLSGGTQNDRLEGGLGNDVLNGDEGQDSLSGGDGNDILSGGDGADDLFGGTGDDYLMGNAGLDMIYGGDGADQISGGLDSDNIYGGSGGDQLTGDGGDDFLNGGSGQDIILGGDGNDTLHGGLDEDILLGGIGQDTLFGGSGGDELDGGDGADNLWGGTGQDALQGGSGNDVVNGDAGNDFVYGGSGDDTVYGGDGDDEVSGGSGADTLNGGAGNDFLLDSSGADTFEFKSGDGDDYVFGFSALDDVLHFTGGLQRADLELSAFLNHTVIDYGADSVMLLDVSIANQDDLIFIFG